MSDPSERNKATARHQDFLSYAKSLDDSNMCVVRAVCVASGCTPERAFSACRYAGRIFGTGLRISLALHVLTHLGVRTGVIMRPRRWRRFRHTSRSITKAYPKGMYLLLSKRHVATMVDGEILDWSRGTGKRIEGLISLAKGM